MNDSRSTDARGRGVWLVPRARLFAWGPIMLGQGLEVRFQPPAVDRRMPEQRLDEAAFPQAKVPVNASAGQHVQPTDRQRGQEFFKFVSGH